MRIEQNVRHHPTLGERHVLSGPQSAQNALLPVPTGKFVSDGWVPRDSHCDANTLEFSTPRFVTAYFNVVHNTIFFTPKKK